MEKYPNRELSVGRAMGLMSGVSIISKLLALAVQWILGLRLLPEDFALYGSVLAAQGLVAVLKDSGVGKFLIQKNNYDRLAYVASLFSVFTGVVAAFVLVVFMPLLESGMQQPDLFWVMLPVLLAFPVQSLTNVFSAKLRLDGSYWKIAAIEVSSSLIKSLATIALVVVGAGVYALVIGGVLQVLCSYFSYRMAVGSGYIARPWGRADLLQVFSVCKWIMLAGGATALVLRAEYFVMGFSPSKVLVGQYFFGIQLVMSLTVLLTSSFQTVLLPAMARHCGNLLALQKAYDSAHKHISRYSAAGTIFVCFAAPHVMRILWNDRWEGAAQVVQWVVLAIGLKFHVAVSGILLEACGLWRLRIITLLLEAAFVAGASSLIFVETNLANIALAVGLARVLVGAGQIVLTQRYTRIGQGVVFRILPIFAIYILIGCVVQELILPCFYRADKYGDMLAVFAYLIPVVGVAWCMLKLNLYKSKEGYE